MINVQKTGIRSRREVSFAGNRQSIRIARSFRRKDYIALSLLRAWFFGSLSLLIFILLTTVALVGEIPTVQRVYSFVCSTGPLLIGIYAGSMIIVLAAAWVGADYRYKAAVKKERSFRILEEEERALDEESLMENDAWTEGGLWSDDGAGREEGDEQSTGAEAPDQPDRRKI